MIERNPRPLRSIDRRAVHWNVFDRHRQLDDEDASLAWPIVETDIAAVDLDGLSSDRETQAEPALIGLTPAGKIGRAHV